MKKGNISICLEGVVIDTKKRASNGNNIGFCGQSFGGSLMGYTFGVGIYTMSKDIENDCMNVVNVVADMPTIRKAAKKYFSQKRFMFIINDKERVYYYEFLASENLEIILETASLNTNTRCGVCFRDVKGFGEILAKHAELLASFEIPFYCEKYLSEKKRLGKKFNLGNFSEYLLSGKESDLDERRFEKKKQDVYYNGKRYELKTSLNIPVKDKSTSNTNFFFTL